MSFITVLSKEIMEQRRTHKLLVALAVLVLFGMTSPLMAKMTPQIMTLIPGAEAYSVLIPEPTINDAVAQYLKNTTQFGVLLALIFSMGAIVTEKEKGTAAMILSKPISRGSFVLGKFIALSFTFALSVLLAGISCYYYTYFLFGELNLPNWLLLNGLTLLYILMFVAITLFFSTLVRTQYAAIGFSFGVMLLLGILGGLPEIGVHFPVALISNAALQMTGQSAVHWIGLWICLGLIFSSLLGAWLVFRKQEL